MELLASSLLPASTRMKYNKWWPTDQRCHVATTTNLKEGRLYSAGCLVLSTSQRLSPTRARLRHVAIFSDTADLDGYPCTRCYHTQHFDDFLQSVGYSDHSPKSNLEKMAVSSIQGILTELKGLPNHCLESFRYCLNSLLCDGNR